MVASDCEDDNRKANSIAENWRRRVAGARWWRDTLFFAAGAICVSAVLASIGWVGSSGDVPGAGSDCLPTAVASAGLPWSGSEGADFAFIQLAITGDGDGGGSRNQLWRVLAMARAVQRVSAFPLIVLADSLKLPDGTDLAPRLTKRFGVRILPLIDIPMPDGPGTTGLSKVDRFAHQKLQMWRLTDFRKLIWLDTDTILLRSIDWLFSMPAPQAQMYNPDCSASPTNGLQKMSGGLLLIEPDNAAYKGLLSHAAGLVPDLWRIGPDMVIQSYFKDAADRPVKLLNTSVAAFGSCLGSEPHIGPDRVGLPALVHKPASGSACFDIDISAQLDPVDGKQVNVCSLHPVGLWWRNLFCEAAETLEILEVAEVKAFCDDAKWYHAKTE